jgi:hypothetical protein
MIGNNDRIAIAGQMIRAMHSQLYSKRAERQSNRAPQPRSEQRSTLAGD